MYEILVHIQTVNHLSFLHIEPSLRTVQALFDGIVTYFPVIHFCLRPISITLFAKR